MKRILIFGSLAFAIGVGWAVLRLTRHYRIAVLNRGELELKQSKPTAPPRDCSEVNRALERLRMAYKFPDEAPLNRGPLTVDEIEVYKATLLRWSGEGRAPLNVSLNTYPLDSHSLSGDLLPCECMRNVDPEEFLLASHSTHVLTKEVLPTPNMRLVNPVTQTSALRKHDPERSMAKGRTARSVVNEAFANGLFALSEIAFDKAHQHAIVSYGFHCGMLCGSGMTLVFEKVGNQWRPTKTECSGWVS